MKRVAARFGIDNGSGIFTNERVSGRRVTGWCSSLART